MSRDKDRGWQSDKLLDVLGVEPANLVEGLPKLACLVDVNLAGLLSIRLSEFLVNSKRLNSLDEDSAFRSQVGGAVEAEIGCQVDLVGVKKMSMRVGLEIDRRTFPVNLEAMLLVWQAR